MFQKTYFISGMTCQSCVARVQAGFLGIAGVVSAVVSLNPQEAILVSKHEISLQTFKNALARIGNYDVFSSPNMDIAEAQTSYKPLYLIAAYLVFVSAACAKFDAMLFMRYFMAGFFLVFSFFKMLDVPAFAKSYQQYDLIASKFKAYGYIYPFIELLLGVLYLTNFMPKTTNVLAFLLMAIGIVGVGNAVFRQKKIQCACLGTVFRLPMSTVTIIEDGIMILMAGFNIIYLF